MPSHFNVIMRWAFVRYTTKKFYPDLDEWNPLWKNVPWVSLKVSDHFSLYKRYQLDSTLANDRPSIQLLQIVKQMTALYRIFRFTHIRINVPEYEHYAYRNWVNRWIMPLVILRAKLLIWTRWRSHHVICNVPKC